MSPRPLRFHKERREQLCARVAVEQDGRKLLYLIWEVSRLMKEETQCPLQNFCSTSKAHLFFSRPSSSIATCARVGSSSRYSFSHLIFSCSAISPEPASEPSATTSSTPISLQRRS